MGAIYLDKQITIDNTAEVVFEISNDLTRKKIYDKFPKIKSKLSYINTKLYKSLYVVNSENLPTLSEIHFLEEQGYEIKSKDKNYIPKSGLK